MQVVTFRFTQESISKAFWECVSDFPVPQLLGELTSRSMRPQNLAYLGQLCLKLKPSYVVEVGSGQSTLMMLQCGVKRIVTCDRNGSESEYQGVEMHACEATQMLEKLTEAPDLFLFDGRLKFEDFDHVKRLSKENTWYVFDDFEGLEKGVANVAALYGGGRFLITPQPGSLGRSTLAVLAPANELQFSIYG